VLPRAQDAEQAECAGNRSRVDGDKRTDGIAPRSDFPDASVDPTEARSAEVKVISQQTAWFDGGSNARATVEDHVLGWYQALIEARIPFETVHDRLLDPAHVGAFKTLILPNIATLSDQQCQQLRAFVDRCGSLVATYETSLFDEWGVKRRDFGLAELFGASCRGHVPGPVRNSYVRLEDDPRTHRRHSLLAGLDDSPRVIGGTFRLDVAANRKFDHPPLTLIPAYPDLTMENVYPRVSRSDTPQVYLREIGPARIVYFPWNIVRVFWKLLSVDHGLLLRNAVSWATAEEPPVQVTGPGVLDVAFWRQKRSLTVHLVNLTNPMMMKGPVREFVPVGPQQVIVRLRQGATAKKVQLLVADQIVPAKQAGGRLTLAVPSILDHEVVAVDL
jgi:hypothetical protein